VAPLAALLFILGPAAAPADTIAGSATATWDLPRCVKGALGSSPDLGMARADLAAARARLGLARSARFGEDHYRQVLGLVNRARGSPLFSPDDKNDFLNGLGPFSRLELLLNVPIYAFGRIDAAIAAAETGMAAEAAGGEAKRGDVVLEVQRLYYALLLSREVTRVLKEMLDRLDQAITTTEERLQKNAKGVTESDLLTLRIGRAKLAAGEYASEAAAELGKSALARAVGLSDPAGFEIADQHLVLCPAPEATLEKLLDEARKKRPELRALALGVRARWDQVRMTRAGYYPVFALTLGAQWAIAPNREEQNNPFAYDEFNYIRPIIAVALTWNINFFETAAKVAEAEAALARSTAEEERGGTGIALEVRRAFTDMSRARRTLAAATEGSKAGRALLVISSSNFDLGIGDADELFKGLTSYAQSHTDYLRAVHDYNLAWALLSHAVGREVEPPSE
jgi:outer membrane protein TolC